MAIDSKLLGETTVEMMETLEAAFELEDGKMVAVGIVVVLRIDGENVTRTRTFCSDSYAYMQRGLFTEALDVVDTGTAQDDD